MSSLLFFTKKVFERDDPVAVLGVNCDEVAQSFALRDGHHLLNDPDHRFILWRDYFYPEIKSMLVWRYIHWIRIVIDRTDKGHTRVWAYGRCDYVPNIEAFLFGLLLTRFVSFNPPLHLAAFNRSFAAARFSARQGSAWKIEKVRVLQSVIDDTFNFVISNDYEEIADYE